MKNGISVVLTGGGTGGHIYPAIAVTEILKKDPEITNIYYIGCEKNPEKDIVSKENIEFFSLNVSGMPRKTGFKFLLWTIELIIATNVAIFYLLKLKPDVVFGTGGYVSGPVLLAAWLLKIPYIIHDPDAHPGIVNKTMSKWAKTVSIAFEQAKKHIKNPNIKLYGNPMRGSLKSTDKKQALSQLGLSVEKKTILAIGGSQGAKTINEAMMDAVPLFIKEYGFQIIHQTGKKMFDEYIKAFYAKYPDLKANPAYIVKPYFDDMSIPLNAADIAISRAGSLSISELNLCELPSALIPYPYAAADHQRFNAKAMEALGAAVYLEDRDCSSEKFVQLINSILNNPEKLQNMKNANRELAKPDSAENIVKELKKVAKTI
ncbi:MAG TPA: undecaprenyldiphospho-muramoylpentapeptide beta-N-acetylglucosaminyltransferase [Candidatus Gastranaerophilales bacterium]|nr:undecaprenyldiphospho-muramoylpentapeptide beta-N-acetylglucosaminyltransferase [Candidatus Gastranaerophilales bacterium]